MRGQAGFELGMPVTTSGVHDWMWQTESGKAFVEECLTRHLDGDWGEDIHGSDAEANDRALNGDPGRLLSSYRTPASDSPLHEDRIWIITEWDRSVTTVLFPSEY